MCIYCLEGVFVDELVRGEFEDVYANALDPFYFQEVRDIADFLHGFPRKDHVSLYIDVAFCRIWEKMILQDVDEYSAIVQYFDSDLVDRFMNALRNEGFEINHALGHRSWYLQGSAQSFEAEDIEMLIHESRSFLELYYRSELCGSGEVLKAYKNIDTELLQGDCYNITMCAAYYSFLILSKYSPYDEILIKIATTNSTEMPDSFALDLWLQRKAFAHCLKIHGSGTFVSNVTECRMNLILYGVSKSSMEGGQFSALDVLLQKHHEYSVFESYRKDLETMGFRS